MNRARKSAAKTLIVVGQRTGTSGHMRGRIAHCGGAPESKTQHGPDAPIHAAMRADAMLEKGDLDGCAVWKRIVKAVEELLSKERPAGVAVQ